MSVRVIAGASVQTCAPGCAKEHMKQSLYTLKFEGGPLNEEAFLTITLLLHDLEGFSYAQLSKKNKLYTIAVDDLSRLTDELKFKLSLHGLVIKEAKAMGYDFAYQFGQIGHKFKS